MFCSRQPPVLAYPSWHDAIYGRQTSAIQRLTNIYLSAAKCVLPNDTGWRGRGRWPCVAGIIASSTRQLHLVYAKRKCSFHSFANGTAFRGHRRLDQGCCLRQIKLLHFLYDGVLLFLYSNGWPTLVFLAGGSKRIGRSGCPERERPIV